ncbi:MAG: T9SS type A sorting domain-containing protein [Flavobacteriales bacterium]
MQPYLCNATAPNLGADQTTCGTAVTLNSNISAGAGITHAWYKDDVLIGSATGSTYSTALAGKYKVVVTNNGCPKFDEINVTLNSALATVGDTVCTTSESAVLKVNTPGGPYSWYAAQSGGSALHTGSTYSKTVSATKDFYVEGVGGETKVLGPKYPINDVEDQTYTKGWYENFATGGDSLSVDFDVNATIDSILVYSDYTGTNKNLVFSVFTKNNALVGTKSYTILAGTEKVLLIPIGISVPAGLGYKLTLRGTAHSLWYDAATATYPYTISGLGKINYGLASWGPDNALYPGFYNLTLTTGSGSGGFGRQAVKVLPNPCTSVQQIDVDAASVFPNPSNESFTIDLKNTNEVRSLQVYDVAGKMIQSLPVNSKITFGENLKSGVYFVKIISENGMQNVQVIKNYLH